jgi:high-affinity K+ transport system ATPase subunit B
VSQGGVHLGGLRIADVLRPEAVEAVRALREMSIKRFCSRGIGPRLAVRSDSSFAWMRWRRNFFLSRSDRVRSLRASGKAVAMVGDGINDARTLMEAGEEKEQA